MDARQAIGGRLISERRAAAGLTVRQLADQLGIDARTLADFERNFSHDSYALGPNLGVLTGEERRRLHRTHVGRVGLTESVAFVLLGVVTGYRSQDWLLRLPADDRRGIELLTRQGLIELSGQDRWQPTWQPTADVLYSLRLHDRYDEEAAPPTIAEPR